MRTPHFGIELRNRKFNPVFCAAVCTEIWCCYPILLSSINIKVLCARPRVRFVVVFPTYSRFRFIQFHLFINGVSQKKKNAQTNQCDETIDQWTKQNSVQDRCVQHFGRYDFNESIDHAIDTESKKSHTKRNLKCFLSIYFQMQNMFVFHYHNLPIYRSHNKRMDGKKKNKHTGKWWYNDNVRGNILTLIQEENEKRRKSKSAPSHAHKLSNSVARAAEAFSEKRFHTIN